MQLCRMKSPSVASLWTSSPTSRPQAITLPTKIKMPADIVKLTVLITWLEKNLTFLRWRSSLLSNPVSCAPLHWTWFILKKYISDNSTKDSEAVARCWVPTNFQLWEELNRNRVWTFWKVSMSGETSTCLRSWEINLEKRWKNKKI